MWKAINTPDHPFKIQKPEPHPDSRISRWVAAGLLKESATSKTSKATFIADGIHTWNKALKEIKDAKISSLV